MRPFQNRVLSGRLVAPTNSQKKHEWQPGGGEWPAIIPNTSYWNGAARLEPAFLLGVRDRALEASFAWSQKPDIRYNQERPLP